MNAEDYNTKEIETTRKIKTGKEQFEEIYRNKLMANKVEIKCMKFNDNGTATMVIVLETGW